MNSIFFIVCQVGYRCSDSVTVVYECKTSFRKARCQECLSDAIGRPSFRRTRQTILKHSYTGRTYPGPSQGRREASQHVFLHLSIVFGDRWRALSTAQAIVLDDSKAYQCAVQTICVVRTGAHPLQPNTRATRQYTSYNLPWSKQTL